MAAANDLRPVVDMIELSQQQLIQNSAHAITPTSAPAKPRTSFAADVLKLVSGSASAQLLSILVAPLIARLFAPAAFGTAALFVSIAGLISAVVGMRYELSIVLPDKEEEAANSAAVSFCFILLITVLTAGLMFFAGPNIVALLRAPELKAYLWLVPAMVLLNGIYAAFGYWNTRQKQFGRQTVIQVASTVFFVVTQIAAGVAGYVSGGMIIAATVLSTLLGTLLLGSITAVEWARFFAREVTGRRMLTALKRYSSFPKYSTMSAVLNNLGWQMPTFMLSAFFSPAVVGYYALGNRLLRIPINLVGVNIATVFFQHAAEANHCGGLRHSVDRLFQYLARLFVFPSLVLCFIGKDLFAVVFGSRWGEAGIYTQILSIYVLFWFMSVPLGIALNVLEKQALELRLITVVLLARFVALYIGGEFGSARITLALFTVAGVSVYAYYCWVVLRHCGVQLGRVGQVFGKEVVLFAPAGLILGMLKYAAVSSVTIVMVACVLFALYCLNLLRTDAMVRRNVAALFKRFEHSAAAADVPVSP